MVNRLRTNPFNLMILLSLFALIALVLSACSVSSSISTIPSTDVTKRHSGHNDVSFETYNDYCQFVEQHPDRLPENFVHADNFECLGSFDYMMVVQNWWESLYTDYHYGLLTEWGQLTIYVAHNGTPSDMDLYPAIDMESATAKASSLCNITTGGAKVSINRDGIIFRYHESGELRDIIWFVDSVMYHIYFNNDPLEAFSEHHPLLSKLLSLSNDDFQAAKAQLTSIGVGSAEAPSTAPTSDSD